MKIEIKCLFSGLVLFSHDQPDNTSRLTLEAAVRVGADLAGADLAGADLTGADLTGADLAGADLAGADLAGADLAGATLIGKRPIFQIGPIGSRCAYFVAYITDRGLRLRAGCFFGTRDEFEKKLLDERGENEHAQEYHATLAMIDAHAAIWTPKDAVQKKGEA